MFSEIRLEANNHLIDSIKSPGIATTLKNYASSAHSQRSESSDFAWVTTETPALNRRFSYCVPLKKYLGFFDDYRKILFYNKLELILLRSRSDAECLVRAHADNLEAATINIELTNVSWLMTHIDVKDVLKLQILKVLQRGQMVPINFRSWNYYEHPGLPQATTVQWSISTTSAMNRPSYVLFGFQTNRRNNTELSASSFDHVDLRNVQLYLNNTCYPYENMNISFSQNKYSVLYKMFTGFLKSYYGYDNDEHMFDKSSFKHQCPIIVLDTSNSPSIIKDGACDVRAEFNFNTALPANTIGCCLMISDKFCQYNPFTNLVTTDS